jgi:hypothetical protein
MRKLIYFLLTFIILTGCRTSYVEVYHIEREPVTWCETIYTDPTHWHFRGIEGEWNCVEIPSDTFDIMINDTIVEKIYMGTYKKKEYKIKWDIKNYCKNEGKKCN